MKPSERIYRFVNDQKEREKSGGYVSQYIPGYVEKLIPAIIKYLDEQAEKEGTNK